MKFSSYYLIYFSTGLLSTYTLYRLMNIFFEHKNTNEKIEVLSYILYYLLINILYLTLNLPILTLLANIICLIFISFNYKSNTRNRIIAIVLTYLILMIVETIVTLLTGYLITSVFDQSHEYPPAIGYVLSSFIGFFVVLFIEDYSDIKKGAQVNTRYWLSILAICFSLLYIIVNLVDAQLDINKTSIIISLLLIITIIIFYLFDGLKKSAETEIKNLVLEREKQYYIKQFELMESSVLNVASLKHDISNHIGTIGALIYSDEKSKALRYINQFDEFVDFGNRYITSGNPVIDSILNFKLGYLKSQEIVTNIDIVVPSDLYLEVFDMVVILGNLIDNAIEALEKLDDNKKLSVSIKYKLGILTISVENTFSGDISLNEKGIVTSKKDKDNHGLGLKNIESTLEKYDGIMEYEYTDNAFIVEILMYIN